MTFFKRVLPLFISLLFVFGCNNNIDDISLVASEKNLPSNFNEIAVERKEGPHFKYLVSRVDNQTQYEEVRSFRLEKQIPKVNFEENIIFFIGLHESGSFPFQLEDIKINSDNQVMNIHLSEPKGACTADATPRTFVIEVNKESSNELKNVIIVESGVEITVSIDGNKSWDF